MICILIIFLFFSLFLFYIYIYPYIVNNIKYEKRKGFHGTFSELEKSVFDQAYKMAFSSQNLMSMHEFSDFKTECIKLYARRYHYREARFFFPRAFLFYALFEYSKKKQLTVEFNSLKKVFDSDFIQSDGLPTFKIDRVDQVVFGLVALTLYKQTKEKKYKIFTDYCFQYLLSNADKSGIVVYRKTSGLQHVDAIGMIVPFLMEYAKVFLIQQAEKIALENLNYYIKYGLDNDTGLPFHAFDLKTKFKQGPMNWGRGLVWFYLGLLFVKENTSDINQKDIVNEQINKIENYLSKVESQYAQFIGLKSSTVSFDSSVFASLAFIHKRISFVSIDYTEIKKYITEDGIVLSTSGDTMGINNYARISSPSEFTQAMLLLSFI